MKKITTTPTTPLEILQAQTQQEAELQARIAATALKNVIEYAQKLLAAVEAAPLEPAIYPSTIGSFAQYSTDALVSIEKLQSTVNIGNQIERAIK